MRCALQFRAVFSGDDFLHGKTSAEFSRRDKLCRYAEADLISLAEFCRFPLGIVFQSHGKIRLFAHIARIFAELRILHRVVKIVAGAVFPVAHAVQLFIPTLIEAVILAIAQISVYRGAVSILNEEIPLFISSGTWASIFISLELMMNVPSRVSSMGKGVSGRFSSVIV